jgi:hypothetical protein
MVVYTAGLGPTGRPTAVHPPSPGDGTHPAAVIGVGISARGTVVVVVAGVVVVGAVVVVLVAAVVEEAAMGVVEVGATTWGTVLGLVAGAALGPVLDPHPAPSAARARPMARATGRARAARSVVVPGDEASASIG